MLCQVRVAHACNPSTLGLHSETQASLGDETTRKNKQQKKLPQSLWCILRLIQCWGSDFAPGRRTHRQPHKDWPQPVQRLEMKPAHSFGRSWLSTLQTWQT